ncbi:hypothetical protein K491DRAFT_684262 [Lophiostoma macrostomum CBS 122681]|uniref:Uncharacterized protein n=1 Tax=Lophiostoma macrostomum CBS 122681 TaxID=1314788 RepID=A0A6A6SN79_9PLEO|nr:hypothetical protein K491DRAFT_684262 [Lophiostoma macrostomum CBS 122681]
MAALGWGPLADLAAVKSGQRRTRRALGRAGGPRFRGASAGSLCAHTGSVKQLLALPRLCAEICARRKGAGRGIWRGSSECCSRAAAAAAARRGRRGRPSFAPHQQHACDGIATLPRCHCSRTPGPYPLPLALWYCTQQAALRSKPAHAHCSSRLCAAHRNSTLSIHSVYRSQSPGPGGTTNGGYTCTLWGPLAVVARGWPLSAGQQHLSRIRTCSGRGQLSAARF